MSARGKTVTFHGAYGTKAKAKRKEKKVGGFIKKTVIRGETRYLVLTGRKR